jgi:hypothetical protein
MDYSWKENHVTLTEKDIEIYKSIKSLNRNTEYKGVGEKVNLEIWRIEKQKLKKWPLNQYVRILIKKGYFNNINKGTFIQKIFI